MLKPLIAGVLLLIPVTANAQATGEHDVAALAKATQNPVGDLTTLPFQFNFNTGGDLGT
jgi:hypothetical protein